MWAAWTIHEQIHLALIHNQIRTQIQWPYKWYMNGSSITCFFQYRKYKVTIIRFLVWPCRTTKPTDTYNTYYRIQKLLIVPIYNIQRTQRTMWILYRLCVFSAFIHFSFVFDSIGCVLLCSYAYELICVCISLFFIESML